MKHRGYYGNFGGAFLPEILVATFDELEKNWYSVMQKKATWLTILITHLYEMLFFLESK